MFLQSSGERCTWVLHRKNNNTKSYWACPEFHVCGGHRTERGGWVCHACHHVLPTGTTTTTPLWMNDSNWDALYSPGVRRRIKSSKDVSEPEELVGASNEKPPLQTTEPPSVSHRNKCDQNPQVDPLKWFGILVPQTLKQAQSSFRQGRGRSSVRCLFHSLFSFRFNVKVFCCQMSRWSRCTITFIKQLNSQRLGTGDKYPWKEINSTLWSCTYLNSHWYQHSCFFFFVVVIELSAEIATLQAAVLKTREEFKLGLKLNPW